MNRRTILKEAISSVSDDTKLVRLATITTFIHSLLFILYLIYLSFTLAARASWGSWWIGELLWDYINLVAPNTEVIVLLIIIWIVLVIGYSILPPIWDAAMIYYVDSNKKSWSASLGSWFWRFFPMFEFNATISFLNIIAWMIAASRMYAMGIINWLTVTLLVIWLFISFLALFLLPYTKFLITLEWEDYFDAMKKSMWLSIRHFVTTSKFVTINLFLYLRFILNIIIVIWIPLSMIYFASKFDFWSSALFQTLVITCLILLIALTAYINGIIEAFFITYRWKVYTWIRAKENGEEEEEEIQSEWEKEWMNE